MYTMPLRRKDGLAWHEEKRNEPDIGRQRAFKGGWTKGVESNHLCDEAAVEKVCSLERLTNELSWWNLGYRLGRIYRETSDELVQEIFQWSEKQYQEMERKGSQ